MEIAKTLAKITPYLSELKLESQAKQLYSYLEAVKRTSNKENLPANNLPKKPSGSQKFMQNLITGSVNPRSSLSQKLERSPEVEKQADDHNRYIKKLVGMDIARSFQRVDEPQESLPQINDISMIREENPNQVTMIEHSELSQNNTFLQREDGNESSLINYEESDM